MLQQLLLFHEQVLEKFNSNRQTTYYPKVGVFLQFW